MGTHLWTWTVCLVLLYGTSTTVTGLAAPAKCRQECPSSSTSVFNYQDGHKYTYNLEGTSITTLPGTQGDVSKLQLKATVELSVQSVCSHLIQLKNVQIIGAAAKKYTSLKSLEEHPALSNFQGGVINSQLCTDEGDNQASLNIKRAVLSLLQVPTSVGSGSGSSFAREVDVFGICPTEITSSKEGDATVVKKSRNLNRCAHREDLKQEVLSTPFVGNADLHSTPLLESTYSSEHHIKRGVINSAESQETYLYRPFSKLGSGARTIVETKLTLVSNKPNAAAAPASLNVPKSIIFEAPHRKEPSAGSNKQEILDALRAAGDTMHESVGTESARKFRDLVVILRDSSKEDILSVYGEVKAGAGFSNKRAARKVLLDAIFRAGTGDSVIAAVELLKSHEIQGELTRLWYISIGFTRSASASSLAAVSTLLDDTSNLPREAILAVGSLAGRFCRENDCENVPQLNELIAKLAKLIKTNIKSIEEENKVIVALKALGNIHHLNDAVAEKLKKVASDKSIPARVRVAALETYQTDACRSALRNSALEILKDTLEDSEVRIKAYLALAECPSGAVANNLKELLEKEPTYQVGSFIVSHLRNLRSSANPSKAEAKKHFQSLRPRKHFPEDFRKFSRNYELSYILDGLNIGNSLESNVIYSQNSYVPRSLSLNLTTEIFGHSYNVLEVSTRAENVDRLLESYFGPKGLFKAHGWSELIDSVKEIFSRYSTTLKDKFEEVSRQKRSISKGDLERLKNEVIKSLPPSHKSNELILDLSLKLFGSELAWINADHSTRELSGENVVNKIFDLLLGAVDEAKSFNHELRNHYTFLDSQLTYPTGLGLPLKLKASGSTAVHLFLSGKIDIPTLIKDPLGSALQLEVKPSAAIEIFGTLTVASPVEDSGLKVTYTLHTDTGLSIDAKALNREGFDVKIGLPVKKQDILTVKTEVLSVIHERGHKEALTPLEFNINRKDYKGCFDQASPLIGLTLCADVGFPYDLLGRPSALYPLNGPSILSLRLESDDVDSYHFKILGKNPSSGKYYLELLFETPNSKVDRKLEFIVESQKEPNWEVKASLKSPWKVLVLQGIVIDSNEEQSLTAKFLDDSNEYSVKLGAKVKGDPSHQIYTPLLEYKAPDSRSTKGRKTSSRSSQSYHVRGVVTVDKDGPSRKLTFNKVSLITPQGDVQVDGILKKDDSSFVSDVVVSYGSQSVELKSKLQKVGNRHYIIGAGVIPSKRRDLGFELNWEFEQEPNEFRNDLIIIHGSDLKSTVNRITANQQLHFKFVSLEDFDISTKNSLTYPYLSVNVKLNGNAKPKNINYDLAIDYDNHKISSILFAQRDVKKPGDFDVDFMVQILSNSLKLNVNREILGPDRSRFVNLLELSSIVKYDLRADVTHKYHHNNVDLQLQAVLKIDDDPVQFELDSGIILNPDLLDTHAKLKFGPDTILDSIVNINRKSGYPSGNIKVAVVNIVDAVSTFNYNKAGGQGTLTINLPSLKRKIQGNADLTITGTIYAGKADLLWNADVNPNQKLSIQTTSDIKADSIDSKNTVYFVDYKTVLNIKGALTGKVTDGHLIANGDLILPTGRQFTVKYDETLHVRQTNSEGRVEIILIDIPKKGSQPRRLSLEAAAKDVDLVKASFEGSGKLEYKCPEGRNVKLTVHSKNIPQGDTNKLGAEVQLDGSFVPHPIKVKADAEVSKVFITYKGSASYGSDSSVHADGTLRRGHDSSPWQIKNNLEVKLPNEALNQVKLSTDGTLQISSDKKIELKSDNALTWNTANTVEINGELSGDVELGSGKITIVLPKEKARSLAVTWSNPAETRNGLKKGGSLALHWDGDKEINVAGEIEVPYDKKYYKLKLSAATPSDRLKQFDLVVLSKDQETPARHVLTEAILLYNDKKVTLISKIGLAPGVPLVDITIDQPIGTSKLYLNVDKFTTEEAKLQLEVQWAAYGGGSLTSDGEVRLSTDDFKLLWNIDSPKLNIKKVHVDIGHRAAKGAKKIFITIKNAEKSLLTGSTTLHRKTDENSVTYDGNGAVSVGDQSRHFNFRIERSRLRQDSDGETGLQLKLNAKYDSNEFEGLLKTSDKEFHYLNKFCDKEKHCATIETKSKLKIKDITIDHEVVVVFDLRAVATIHGIDLRAKTIRDGWNVDQGIDLQIFSPDHETKYTYKLVIGQKNSVLTITTPQRVIALEVNTVANFENAGKKGHYEADFKLWWDKIRKPASHAEGSLLFTHNIGNNGAQLNGEAKFNNPSLERELVVRGKTDLNTGEYIVDSSLDLDVFKKENQKITVLLKVKDIKIARGLKSEAQLDIKSRGQNLDIVIKENKVLSLTNIEYDLQGHYKIGKQPKKEAELKLAVSPDSQKLLVKIPGDEILNVVGSVKKVNDLPVVDVELTILGHDTLVIHSSLEKKGLLTFTSHVSKKNAPNSKVILSGGIDDGVALRAERVGGGELFHVSISTKDEDFLKTNFDWSTENIKKLLDEVRQEAEKLLQRVKKVLTDYVNLLLKEDLVNLLELLKKNQPNFKRLLEIAEQQLKQIRNEIENDQVLHEISEHLKKLFGDVAHVLEETIKGISATLDTLYKGILDIENTLIEAIKNATPAISEAWTKVVESLTELANVVLQEFSIILNEVIKFIQANEEEVKHYLALFSVYLREIGKLVNQVVKKFVAEILDFSQVIIDEVKSLQIYNIAKEQYNELVAAIQHLEVPENIGNIIQELIHYVKESLPTEELRDLVTQIEVYIQNLFSKEKVESPVELQVIYDKLVKAIKSVVAIVKVYINEPEAADIGILGQRIPLSISSLLQLPRLVAIRLSPLTYIISEELPDLTELYYTYRPTLHPLDWVPPFRAHAILAGSNNFFTFDHRHYKLKGSCSYLLAQDYYDGNFSITANLEGGELKFVSITNGKDTIELLSDKSVKVNGAPAEYPVHQGEFSAWYQTGSVNVKSSSGVRIHYHTDANILFFEVSGFYFARTRGLLGTINYEPWDDYTIPNGHVAAQASEFGNAWKLSQSCPDVTAESTSDAPVAECSDIFSGNTVLRACFPFIKPNVFRDACNDAVRSAQSTEEKKKAACDIAAAYVEACKRETPIVTIPLSCVHCSAIGGSKFGIGDVVSLKVPQRSADIIVLLERTQANAEIFKELITPLVPTLTNDLKAKGINDVKFILIGFGGRGQKWPHYYTSGGQPGFGAQGLTFTENVPDEDFDIEDFDTFLKWAKQAYEKEMQRLSGMDAFYEATRYPFRVGAVKTIVSILGSPCEETTILTPISLTFATKLYNQLGITSHLITPIEDFTAGGKEDKLVGFDSETTFSLADARKRSLDGDSELRKTLEYDATICTEGAQKTNGAVFNSNNFINNKQTARKQFLQVVSHRIADSLTEAELTEDCTCLITEGIHPTPLCRVQSRREKEQTKTKGVKG